MFASLSNFLFGSASEETEAVAEVELMTSTLPHSDWELVDKVESTESGDLGCANTKTTKKSRQYKQAMSCSVPIISTRHTTNVETHVPCVEMCHSMYDEQTVKCLREENCKCCMEESWVMTPPPCFTASVPGSVDEILHISPLENALIEHPSMSVYHPTKSKSKPKPKKPAKCPKSAKQRKPQTTGSPRRACAVAARVGLLINAESQQMSQRIAESVSVGHVTKKQCERVNKCMKFVSRGSQAKRNNRPCGSINNRAC